MELTATTTATVNNRVSNNATTCGSFVSSARCNGQTMATMNSASANGAKIDRPR